MKFLAATSIIISAAVCLGACSELSGWLKKEERELEAKEERKRDPHPVGVTYVVSSSKGDNRQQSVFFNGAGMARVLSQQEANIKILVDYKLQQVVKRDFDADWQDTKPLDPYEYPCILDAQEAKNRKAICLGSGQTKGFPYHRWSLESDGNEWEVWTDDNDCFPIYYRSIQNGEVTTWTIVNAWIDGSTYDKPTFFSLEPDPPPPAPPKEAIEELSENKVVHKRVHKNKHKKRNTG